MKEVISEMLLDIAQERNGYSIGDPWRFTQHSLAAVVPLVRADWPPERAYRLLSERRNEVKVKDTGDIERILLTNTGEFPVLVKAGEIFAGATQSRTVTISQMVMPGEKMDVPCACVYSSKGIREGQGMTQEAYGPAEVRRAVLTGHYASPGHFSPEYRRDQSTVWQSVNCYSRSAADGVTRFRNSISHSNIVAASGASGLSSMNTTFHSPLEDLAGRVSEAQDKYKEIIEQVPKVEHQVGMALLTVTGMESMEAFEHPDSWEGLRRAILGAESDKISDISDQNGVFEFRPEKAKEIIRELLMGKLNQKVAVDRPRTKTVILDAEWFMGEVVTLDDAPIHCAFVKKAS